jgi:uncharacterized membrane protein
MAAVDRSRSVLATAVGWMLAIVVIVVGLRFLFSSIFWMLRSVFVVAMVGALVMLYLALKDPPKAD